MNILYLLFFIVVIQAHEITDDGGHTGYNSTLEIKVNYFRNLYCDNDAFDTYTFHLYTCYNYYENPKLQPIMDALGINKIQFSSKSREFILSSECTNDYINIDNCYTSVNSTSISLKYLEFAPDPHCQHGRKSENNNYCCPKSCEICNGFGCSGHNGGYENCCGSAIDKTVYTCNSIDAPCKIEEIGDPTCKNGVRGIQKEWVRKYTKGLSRDYTNVWQNYHTCCHETCESCDLCTGDSSCCVKDIDYNCDLNSPPCYIRQFSSESGYVQINTIFSTIIIMTAMIVRLV